MSPVNGILLVDKPKGMTSHDVVDAIRRVTHMKRIGHAGTLDPLATGLLVVCLGKATKLTQFLTLDDKSYDAEIVFGMRSVTYDAEGIDETSATDVPDLSDSDMDAILKQFEGKILQQVPVYSAVKIHGEKLYDLARAGRDIKTPAREVTIHEITRKEYVKATLHIEVNCSKGTYIRSLANDIGKMVGCGAYLSELRRTRSGKFALDDAHSLEVIQDAFRENSFESILTPVEDAIGFPSIKVDDAFSEKIHTGITPVRENIVGCDGSFGTDQLISIKNLRGQIMAIGKSLIESENLDRVSDGDYFKYVRVLS